MGISNKPRHKGAHSFYSLTERRYCGKAVTLSRLRGCQGRDGVAGGPREADCSGFSAP